MPKEPMRGATLFSHANKMTKAYHIMLTPLCKETGLPPFRKYVLNRIGQARAQQVPMTNYGVTIAYLAGILDKIDY